MISHEQDRVISRYLDGAASPEEVARLDEWVRSDPGICREVIRLATQDEMIRLSLAEESVASEQLASGEADRATPGVADEGQVLSVAAGVWRSRWFWSAAAAAALVLCVGGVNVWQAKQAERAVCAAVLETRGQVSEGPASGVLSPAGIRIGETLTPGTRLSLGPDGYAKLAYADGTIVEVAQDTALTLGAGQGTRLFGLVRELRGKRIQLDVGTLTARVAKQKIGEAMALATPHATATVLGTMLQLVVTPESSLLSVQTGQVAFTTATQQEVVSAGESARVQDGVLRKITEPVPPATAGSEYEDGAILFQDSFEKGQGNWLLYTAKGVGKAGDRETRPTTEAQCPDIRIVKVDRDGKPVTAVELVGREPGGRRVGIVTKDLGKGATDAHSLSYEYTYEGRQRRAMEGIEIDMGWRAVDPPDLGRTRTQQARPAGKWNQVRWEYIRKTAPDGRRYCDARLYFNGEFIGRRSEYFEKDSPSPGLLLEVIEGQFRFANVVIREMRKAGSRSD